MVYSYDPEAQDSPPHTLTDNTSARCISVAFQLPEKPAISTKTSSPALGDKLPRATNPPHEASGCLCIRAVAFTFWGVQQGVGAALKLIRAITSHLILYHL